MSVQEFLKVIRERWIVVVAFVAVCLVGAFALFLVSPQEYTATLTMYVTSQTGTTPQAAFSAEQLSSERVKSYTSLVDSPRVTNIVVQQLGLRMSPGGLATKITADSPTDSVLINVAVTDADPVVASRIANAVGTVFTGVVADLEAPSDPHMPTPVAIRVVYPATPPLVPTSAGSTRTLLAGLVAGLILGIAAALIRNSSDTSVKNPYQLYSITRAPNLGAIAYDAKFAQRPLVVQSDPRSGRAEEFRRVRTNLQFVDVDSPPRVVIVTSALAGEGKSTSVANLALTLAMTKVRVLVIDADLRNPSQHQIFGLDQSVGLTSVLSGQVGTLQEAVQQSAGGEVNVLASGPVPPNPSELLASLQMRRLLQDAAKQYDVVLVDTPPLLSVTDAAAVAPAVDGALLVCRAHKTGASQVALATQALGAVSARLLGTLMTMVPPRLARDNATYGTSVYGSSVYAAQSPARTPAQRTTSPRSVQPESSPVDLPTMALYHTGESDLASAPRAGNTSNGDSPSIGRPSPRRLS